MKKRSQPKPKPRRWRERERLPFHTTQLARFKGSGIEWIETGRFLVDVSSLGSILVVRLRSSNLRGSIHVSALVLETCFAEVSS